MLDFNHRPSLSEQISAAEAAGDWTTARQLKAASLANLKDNQSANG